MKGLKSSDDDIVNLDKIIRRWIQTQCSPVTWNTIIESVESVIFGKNLDLGEKIRNWLKEDEHFAYYKEKDNYDKDEVKRQDKLEINVNKIIFNKQSMFNKDIDQLEQHPSQQD